MSWVHLRRYLGDQPLGMATEPQGDIRRHKNTHPGAASAL